MGKLEKLEAMGAVNQVPTFILMLIEAVRSLVMVGIHQKEGNGVAEGVSERS